MSANRTSNCHRRRHSVIIRLLQLVQGMVLSMLHRGSIAFAVIVVLGLTVAFLGVTWLSSPGTGTHPVAAAMPDEGPGDAFNCQTGQPVENAALDILAVSLTSKPGGYEVHVRTAGSPGGVFDNANSAAVVVTLGNLTNFQTRLAEKHAGTVRQGLLDDQGEVIDGTADSVSIGADDVRFNFPGPLKEDASLLVETFHQKDIFDAVTCDAAFSDDPTAPKPTPTASATATDEPTATPGLGTATPTPTATPELFIVVVVKLDVDGAVTTASWEMRIFDGDACLGSPIASADTGMIFGAVTFSLPAGDYSVAKVQRPGWERIGPFCQDFTVVPGGEQPPVIFRNRVVHNGDVNEDGVTNSLDTLLVLQFIAGLLPELPNGERADVNGDGMVNAVDTALMLQFEAGLIPSLPVGGS